MTDFEERDPMASPSEPRTPTVVDPQQGLTLFEVLIAIVLLAAAMLALSAAAGSSLRRASLSRGDMDVWANVTRVVDSLTAEGWGNVTAGSRTKATYTVNWTVTAENADLDRVDVLVGRRGAGGYGSVQDTLTLYLANPQP